MFEVGDKIVCIDSGFSTGLILYETYTVKKLLPETISSHSNMINVEEINNSRFYPTRFITLVEFRRNKILKLKEKIYASR